MTAEARGVRRRATVFLDAVCENARRLAEATPEPVPLDRVVADLRADAYGHGLLGVAATLSTLGISRFVVSDDAARSALMHALPGAQVRLGSVPPSVTSEGATTRPELFGPELFGLGRPRHTAAGVALPLRPALRLSSEVLSVKRVPAGSGVSYGYTYRTAAETTLVLSGLGFADGVPRVASNRAPVLVGSTRARVSGRIAMDQFVVDVGDATVHIGESVVLFGDGGLGEPTAADWAAATGIRSEEIVAGLGPRIERVYES